MSYSKHSTMSYTSISSDSDPLAWGIPRMDVGEVLKMNPYEEVLVYVPKPIKDLEENPEEDQQEDPEEDPVDYVVDADDDEDEEEESSDNDDDDEEEEEHLAPVDSTAVASPAVNCHTLPRWKHEA
ncbi:hypothetical protein Tco_1115608 [Tanacetum coccineum]